MKSIDPTSNTIVQEYKEHTSQEADEIISLSHQTWLQWKKTSFAHRGKLMHEAARLLQERKNELASLMTLEMGKIIRESQAEIDKCTLVCTYYADNAELLLQDEVIASDASRSFITCQPLGVILAVMPWNFPFWQVFRCAAPALMAGNGNVLKHASNVPGCALAIETIFRDAGFPKDLFRSLMIPSTMVEQVINHPFIVATTLTGSELAGSRVAAAAGRNIKKTVLELGGSDPFIVLDDCDLDSVIPNAIRSRMINQGQSCIAAKRFIVMESLLESFTTLVTEALSRLSIGDPHNPATDIGPLARHDLVEEIDRQVRESVQLGAILIQGGEKIDRPGNYYQPTVLTGVHKGMPAYQEETFGPLFAIIPVKSEEEAISVANDVRFGLGGSVWTTDQVRGERIARLVESGAVFVNGITKSDPRLPFGGIKLSGYGRELGKNGIREFVNIKTIWIA